MISIGSASGLRFADSRVQYLWHGIILFRLLPDGFRSADLRKHLASLTGRSPDALSQGAIWACQQGQNVPITVHIYAEGPSSDPSKKTLVTAGLANLDNEPAVDQACRDHSGGGHRFLILLPPELFAHSGDKKLDVHGIRVLDGVPNDAIAGSGKPLTDLPGLALPHPPLPILSGSYHSLTAHPRVFTTTSELNELVSRINRPTSHSRQRFDQLAVQISRDLASHIDWDAAYSGCRVKTYLFAFSYELQESGFLATQRGDLKPHAGTDPPAGAAVVAPRAVLYTALAKAGAILPTEAPSADAAIASAKRILLAWADHGFRDAQGGYRSIASFDCNDDGKPDFRSDVGTGLPLTLGRGVIYSAYAQDLLQSLEVLNASEVGRLNAFHSALFDLIRQSSNKFSGNQHPACERYANGQANALAGLLALARLLDDPHRFKAVLYGADPSIPLVAPWEALFDHAIYGEIDYPIGCASNSGPDSLTSHPSFQTAIVAPGEVEDRYRHANPLQGIGYAMFNLERLVDAAEIIRLAGFDPYGYRGRHRQSRSRWRSNSVPAMRKKSVSERS